MVIRSLIAHCYRGIPLFTERELTHLVFVSSAYGVTIGTLSTLVILQETSFWGKSGVHVHANWEVLLTLGTANGEIPLIEFSRTGHISHGESGVNKYCSLYVFDSTLNVLS